MKNLLLITLAILTFAVQGQQISLNSQYMFNEVSFNPGAAGSKDYIPIHFSARRQWAQFDGAPTTQTLTTHSNIGKNFGFGGSIFNDVTGPSRRTGGMIVGSYHLPISANKEHKIGMGLGASFTQHYMDMDRLTTYLPDDPALNTPYNNRFVPDATVGFYYYFKDKAFLGLSGQNLVQSNRDFYDFEYTFANPMVRNYYLYGGYNFSLGKSKKWGLKPMVMGRMIDALAYSIDGTLIASYNNMIWLGASYRHNDAVVGLLGFQFSVFKIGYSYDYTLSEIGNYSTGSHEIFLELQIFKKDKGGSNVPWLQRNRIYAPAI